MPRQPSIWTVVGWFTASRLIIAAIGLIGVATFVDQRSLEIGGPVALHLDAVWHKWDVVWYERVALHGYGWHLEDAQGQAAAGFFPLYPLMIGLLLRLLPFASFFWVATIASNLFTLAALVLAVRTLATDETQARRMLLIVLTSAGSFYLAIPYTESLFLLLIVVVMALTRRRRFLWAAACAGLAATTRVHGLALIAVPVIACRLDELTPLAARFRRIAVMVVLFAIPIAIYMWHLSVVQGSAQAFVERQAMWDNALPYPLKSLVGLVEHPNWVSGWLHFGVWAVYAGLLARYWTRLPLGEALFCAGALLISTQQETFHGIYRYVMPLMPLTLALADDRPAWRQPLLIGNLVFATIMILAFVTWNRLAV
jgi:Gpi18-like mannosyltransferase